ncbi:hypothetical protein PC123_g26566 [Phytophthora cactorum]|nr:hypothetical protein PC123_g26566 [Phytophthora cactorum]
MSLSVSRVHRTEHPIMPLRQRQTQLPSVPKHKAQQLRESFSLS